MTSWLKLWLKVWLKLHGYLWSIPNTLVGLVLAFIYSDGLRLVEGCIEAPCKKVPGGEWVGAQTHGCVILMRKDILPDYVHVVHQMILGVLFYPAYGAHYVWNRVVLRMDHMTAYRNVWSERLAYDAEERAK